MITIFVAKLDFGVTENELLTLFQQYGAVAKVTIAKDKETNKSRGFAFVEMTNDEHARSAISALDGYSFNGRRCVIKEADERPNNKGGEQRFQRDNREGVGGHKPKFDNAQSREQKPFQRTTSEKPKRTDDFKVPMPDEDNDTPAITPGKPPVVKKKKEGDKPKPYDDTADGKSKKQKMNAYKKSGKDSLYIDDEDMDDELDLFGRDEDEEVDDDYSKYLVNNDDEEEWDEDEEWEDDEEWEEDED